MLTEEILIEMGFQHFPHFTVGNIMVYNLGRNRHLSIGSVGTPNEMLFIVEHHSNLQSQIENLICLHNYDYDGYLSKSKLNDLISSIGTTLKNAKSI